MRGQKTAVAAFAALVVTIGIVRFGSEEEKAPAPELATAQVQIAADERVDWISGGEEVDIFEHLEAGKLTVVEFTAEW